MSKILIVDDEARILLLLRGLLQANGYEIASAKEGTEALELVRKDTFDLIISDIRMCPMDGMTLFREVKMLFPSIPFILLTAYASVETAMEAMKCGAFDYMTKPFIVNEFLTTVKRALDAGKPSAAVVSADPNAPLCYQFESLIASNSAMQQVCQMIQRVAPTAATVLINGESGTGKEAVARTIHNTSPRKANPWITVNCAALPEPLLEAELFGHVKGAFTGAVTEKAGLFETANNGTLFLDEISVLPLVLQGKLLRVLQEKEIRRVGGTKNIPVDVRVIAASSSNLEQLVVQSSFRADLYYRFAVITLDIPPLRDRTEDILPLARHFISIEASGLKNQPALSKEAADLLMSYHWPNNVRELENAIKHAVTFLQDDLITPDLLPPRIVARAQKAKAQQVAQSGASGSNTSLKGFLRLKEKEYLEHILASTQGDKEKAAQTLQVSLATLYRKLSETEEPAAPHPQAEAPVAARKPFEVVRPDDAYIYPYLVGGLLHDSLNTLGALQHHACGLAALAKGIPKPDVLQRTSDQLQSQLKHLNRVLKLLQAVSQEYYAKDPSAAHQPKEHVEEQLKNLHATYPAVRFHASLPPSFNETHLPVGILAFVTGELLTNAARACDVAGEGEVSLAVDFLESGRTLSLECRDSGPGFPPPLLEQLLDGQITPPVKLGTGGYGLYLIKEVVSRLQGSMLFSNLEPSGARVQVLLPNEKVPDAPHLQAEAPAAARKPFEVIRPDDAHIYPYLVGGFLHDSLNTLGALQHQASGLAKLANGTPEPDALQHVATQLDMYLEHLNRVMKLLQAVSQEYYAKDPSAAHQPKEHVEEQLKNLQATYPGVRFHVSIPPSFNETQLPVGILAFITGELLTNAARACAVAGEGEVSLAVDFLESGRTLSLECRDPGPGFPPPLLEQLLDGQITPPDESGKGGYGLYLIKEIKNRLQGSMLFSNLEPSGARVQVLLPVKGLNR